METKGLIQIQLGLEFRSYYFTVPFQHRALVTKFVLEFLCLTVALLACLLAGPAWLEPSTLCHMQYLHSAQDICGDNLLPCQGFTAENGALPNAACLAEKLLGPV